LMRPDVPHLLAKIHDIELVSEASPNTIKSLTTALGVAGAACMIINKITGRTDWVCFSDLSAAFQSDYMNYYDRLDLFAPRLNVDPGWKLSECLPGSSFRKRMV
jgi:hypothetical protein